MIQRDLSTNIKKHRSITLKHLKIISHPVQLDFKDMSTKKKGFVRIVITERFNPLKNIPFLKNPDAPLKIPFTGIDYNKIVD